MSFRADESMCLTDVVKRDFSAHPDELSSSPSASSALSMHPSSNLTDEDASSRKDDIDDDDGDASHCASVCRWIVVAFLAVTATLALSAAYWFIVRAENQLFDQSFQQSARTLMDATDSYVHTIVETFESLADAVAYEAPKDDGEWPFVTIPGFEVKAQRARSASIAEAVYFVPLVRGEEYRGIWERDYAPNNTWWLTESERYAVVSDGDTIATDLGTDMMDDGESVYETCAIDETFSTRGPDRLPNRIFTVKDDGMEPGQNCTFTSETPERDYYGPIWQISPPPNDLSLVNFDIISDPLLEKVVNQSILSKSQTIASDLFYAPRREANASTATTTAAHIIHKRKPGQENLETDIPFTFVFTSIFSSLVPGDGKDVVGFLVSAIPWHAYFTGSLPEDGVDGAVIVVLVTSLGASATYQVDSQETRFIGLGDLHDATFDGKGVHRSFDVLEQYNEKYYGGPHVHCGYTLHVYPSSEYRSRFHNPYAELVMGCLAAVFILTGFVFWLYTRLVYQNQQRVLESAQRSNAIVADMFPSVVRDRILHDEVEMSSREKTASHRLMNYFNGSSVAAEQMDDIFSSKPIAAVSIMFCDVVGFTAWSSVREPAAVFQLLETVYHAFDECAKKRRIFKLETVGDQYVAVAGLPTARSDHAVACCRYARECLETVTRLLTKLEVKFGPDTGDLTMRFGVHSGPVTGGVLRGERARFQLFGDTVNTASRLESTGIPGKIQISEATKALLDQAGKAEWTQPRPETVFAKGKGQLQTYWLTSGSHGKLGRSGFTPSSRSDSLSGSRDDDDDDEDDPLTGMDAYALLPSKLCRLVDWNAELLLQLLRNISARRKALGTVESNMQPWMPEEGSIVIDEVQEIITLPKFDPEAAKNEINPNLIELGDDVENEAKEFVASIAHMYRDNAFHSFQHASHVVMSVSKLMTRIVAPSHLDVGEAKGNNFAHTLHDHTYGITSDPLTQFACVFSALIHDVDHRGVGNPVLSKEDPDLAAKYKEKSVAEQNSVDLAWELLMKPKFSRFRHAIFCTQDELTHFRHLVVNVVLATDIMDKDLKQLRNNRWDKAFKEADESEHSSADDATNRKATIVIEHLIQASDVAHTMQHWHVYRKWNARLFEEMYTAFRQGRSTFNPTEGWAKGEIGFFDFYVIPLAKKLNDCGVFGVSSFEYLDYAKRNRDEWVSKGEEVVQEMIEALHAGEAS